MLEFVSTDALRGHVNMNLNSSMNCSRSRSSLSSRASKPCDRGHMSMKIDAGSSLRSGARAPPFLVDFA